MCSNLEDNACEESTTWSWSVLCTGCDKLLDIPEEEVWIDKVEDEDLCRPCLERRLT